LEYHRIPINAAASAEVSVERHFSSSKRRNGRNFGLLITSAEAAAAKNKEKKKNVEIYMWPK